MKLIEEHPILKFERKKKVKFYFNGREYYGYEGMSVASALYANGIKIFSESVKYKRPRGMFCAIGKCSSCLMRVDGIPNTRICITPLREGMVIETQHGRPSLPTGNIKYGGIDDVECDLLVIGGGPAGLSAALTAAKYGVNVLLVDENFRLGGQLIKQTHKFFGSREQNAGIRGIRIAEKLVSDVLAHDNIKVMTEAKALGYFDDGVVGIEHNRKLYRIRAKNYVIATGASENFLAFENNDLPGVYGAGAAQTLMNVYGVKPGDEAIMVGAGNVGLIVTYQLLQAGVDV
ncbi:MAG: hypothetical protein DRN20_04735 [Thermoplasmata archaeon]|mgnify:CR=1 FL=1|nr:MAG: hypothetical protein DRN20_04735 [Thermoplasmata archaeon]